MRTEDVGVLRNLHIDNTHNKKLPHVTYDIIKGRSLTWQSSTGSKHYLYLNRTVVIDQGIYFCTISEEDTYLDAISPGVLLHVNGKLLITDM